MGKLKEKKKPKAPPTKEHKLQAWAEAYMKDLRSGAADVQTLISLKEIANSVSGAGPKDHSKTSEGTSWYARTCLRPLDVLLRMVDLLSLTDEEAVKVLKAFQAEISRRIESGEMVNPFLDTCLGVAIGSEGRQ